MILSIVIPPHGLGASVERLRLLERHAQANERAAFVGPQELDRTADQLGALAHGDEAQSTPHGPRAQTRAMVLHLELERAGKIAQADPHAVGAGMPRHVAQRLLQHAVHVDADRAYHGHSHAGPLIGHREPQLLLDGAEIPVERALEPQLLEDRRVQRLRQASDARQSALGDLADLAQVGAQRRSGGRLLLGSAEHRSDGGQNLTDLIMKLTRQVPQRGFARGDELLGQLAPAVGERRELGEEPPVGTNQVQPGRRNHHERGRQEPVDLPLHLIVDPLDALSRLLFGFVVLDEQPRDGRTQRRLSRLERQRDLRARGVLPAVSGKRERAIDRVPELGQRIGQPIALRRRAAGRRQFGLSRERVVEIPPMRANCLDQAIIGYAWSSSSMSRIASPSRCRLF